MADLSLPAHADAPQPTVEYRDIPDFPGYRAGNDGTIWSEWSSYGRGARWRRLRPCVDTDGYSYVRLRLNGAMRKLRVHRAVLFAFAGPSPSPDSVGRHLNGVRSDNRSKNLAWGTCLENHQDQVLHGTLPFGEKNRKAKLRDGDVIEIRKLLKDGVLQEDLATRYGVKQVTISKIKLRRTWSHLS